MKITKYGHACLLIEEKNVRILTDPGNFSTGQNELKNIDIILITHEHIDHVDPASLKMVVAHNPEAKIITNQSVQTVLQKEGFESQVVEDGETFTFREVIIEGAGKDHAIFHSTIPPIQNTGYFINGLYHPGDAFPRPKRPVGILALPVAGPWMKISEAIDYALELKPKKCFPIHDGILKSAASRYRFPIQVLEPAGIPFVVLEEGEEYEF